jgi:sporulation protein YlmC with PRC-barrel domain
MTQSNMTQSSTGQSGAMQGQFMTQMQPNQIMASKLIGTRVVSSNNESIGDINDVIVDRNGQAIAAVVGVGGFLGIGEKSVAVPLERIEFTSRSQGQSADTSTSGSGAVNLSSSNTSGSASNNGATGNAGPATTGSTGAAPGSSSSTSSPDRIVLKMTKNDLQQAPAFQTADKARSNESTSGGSTTTRAPNPNPSTGNK